MVADFGIALAVSAAAGGRMTETGLSLGTPHYMSPEQATADKEITGRSDVYSLASVLYEALAGVPPHEGGSAQQVIMRIIADTPRPVTDLRKSVPPNVAAAIAQALEKLPADRFPSARAFAAALEDVHFRTHRSAVAEQTTHRAVPQWAPTAALVATTVLAMAAALWGWLRPRPERPTEARQMHFGIPAPAHHGIFEGYPALSPDGRLLVFPAESAGVRRLFVKRLDEIEARAIPGSEGVRVDRPLTFAPNGSRIVFASTTRLLSARPDGLDLAQPLPGVPPLASFFYAGASWGDDGYLVYVPDLALGLRRISADGGTPEVITAPDPAAGEYVHAWPEHVPGSRTVLFGVLGTDGWNVVAQSLETRRRVTVLSGASLARFVEPGYLVYSKESELYAIRFDRHTLRTSGDAMIVARDVATHGFLAGAYGYFTVSRIGDLAYLSGVQSAVAQLALIDKRGNVRLLKEPSGRRPRFTPDGRAIVAEDENQLWLYDLTRDGTRTRLTSGAPRYTPVPSPDGSRLALSSYETGPAELYEMSLSAAGPSTRILRGTARRYPGSWSSTSNTLAFVQTDPVSGSDIWAVAVKEGAVAETLVRTEFEEYHPRFSPDGRLLAFTSRRSGRPEVFVQQYPAGGTAQRVSSDGGAEPVWDVSGRTLYYRTANRIMSCAIQGNKFGAPREVLRVDNFFGSEEIASAYDVAPDGRSFVVTLALPQPPRDLRVFANAVSGSLFSTAR
jgi:serine/threonine-protein kinase